MDKLEIGTYIDLECYITDNDELYIKLPDCFQGRYIGHRRFIRFNGEEIQNLIDERGGKY
jgi:hypothetical protein